MEAQHHAPPNHILGYVIRSRTRIYISYLIPAVLELIVYITQIVADCSVSYEHFESNQPAFGWGTLVLVLMPPLLTFCSVVSSTEHRNNPKYKNGLSFVIHQLIQLLLFPLLIIYRFMIRIFWSVEALFHDDNDNERMMCIKKTEECSTCELQLMIQAYAQSAPQIILQLYHILTQDLFRNYQTTNAQAICLVFSVINLADITMSYQRFESQRQVGRIYPWAAPKQVEAQQEILATNDRLLLECEKKKRESERTIASFPESDKIMANFKMRTEQTSTSNVSDEKTHEILVQGVDEVDNDAVETTKETVLIHTNSLCPSTNNATDDDKIMISPKLRLHRIREEIHDLDAIEILDTVPDIPAPLPPKKSPNSNPTLLRTQVSTNSEATSTSTSRNKRNSKTLSQLETFKDMLIINTQLYIKDHVPRPPKILINRIDNDHQNNEEKTQLLTPTKSSLPGSPLTPKDVVDFFLPRPTKIVNGIVQEDFASKTIAFFGWISFIIMRMLCLSTFLVFYPTPFFIIISVHYVIMLAALYLETRKQSNTNRRLFYLLLAYIYIFVLLEVRIRFTKIRLWFVGYFVLTMIENIVMTVIWYTKEDLESWWFGFIFNSIVVSGILFMVTLIVYYCVLKPKDVTLLVEDNTPEIISSN
ncbi:uncharacterized protein LOC119685856 isoform X1 [Teleopsis dalmanni]|uniref:uncharacterized protein LOC119685856 isoform X1 n=2 Tax=Teleopsis dalmanni TaxID=139649 RepID=UPI0018CCB4B5|nr:uncharacterized protein LOC119685856 isoform X1 [Teleopsis dalmanni]